MDALLFLGVILPNSVTIQGRTITIPSSGTSPNWAPAMVEFMQAVETALDAVVGPYDVAPQYYTLSNELNAAVPLPLLVFSTSAVRSIYIKYSIYRESTTTSEAEAGELTVVYDTDAGTWNMSREAVGSANLTFAISAGGIVSFTTTAMSGGTYSTGVLSYSAYTHEQSA